jgi:PKD repeat protein
MKKIKANQNWNDERDVKEVSTKKESNSLTIKSLIGGRPNKVIFVAFAIVFVAMVSILIFYACRKDTFLQNSSGKSHKSMEYYDKQLVDQFMQEKLVQEFRNCITMNSFGMTFYDGILCFKYEDGVEALYDTLIHFSNRWDEMIVDNPQYEEYVNSENFPSYPMLFAFETITGFYSLRTHIENQMLELEAEEGISEENDPDDHFIESPYMRVFLTPDCELIVGETIFIIGDQYTVEIDDLNMENLQQTKYFIHTFGEERGMQRACLQGYAKQSNDDLRKDGNCCKNITIKAEPRCDYSCLFSLNDKSSCPIQTCQWYFGDGTTLNAFGFQTLNHTYSSKGPYAVTVDILFFDGTSCTVSTTVVINNNCYIEITKWADKGNSGTVSFSVLKKEPNCNNTSMVSYKWDFGDGTPPITTQNSTIQYQYAQGGKKTVTVTVTFADGCTATEKLEIEIKTNNDCCKMLDSEKDKEIQYSTCNDKKIKHVFSIRNGPVWHRFVVRSVHFEKNKKGKWKRKKADELSVGYAGIVYDKNCETPTKVSGDKAKTKEIEITLDIGFGKAFRIKRHSIHSDYGVKDGNCRTTSSMQNGFSLHDKPC